MNFTIINDNKKTNCPRSRIDVKPTVLPSLLTTTLDRDIWPWPSIISSYGSDPHPCKVSRSNVSWFKSERGNKPTDGRTRPIALPCPPTLSATSSEHEESRASDLCRTADTLIKHASVPLITGRSVTTTNSNVWNFQRYICATRLCNEMKVTGRGVGSGCGVTRRRRWFAVMC